ncbi:MAG TPA: SDR family NAD(P)-dependent oxidoreductase [Ktedonosporobacter sp.]|nr:SDR family NAD(P)-dependent oxidoreductase [Ktedonosporobacter sp.]
MAISQEATKYPATFTGSTVLVTGGGRGIGRAIALAFAEAGATVVVAARTEAELEETARQAKTCNGGSIHPFVCDVTRPEQIQRMVRHIVEHLGTVNILVNAAGRGGGGRTAELDDLLWYDILDANLNSLYLVTKTVLTDGGMLAAQRGRIISIASTGGKQGVVYAVAYTASKHGVVGFTKALGLELARTGITVNAVCPGFVTTKLTEKSREAYARIWQVSEQEAQQRMEARVPLGRFVQPEEIPPMVLYLASPAAAAVTAQAINICGGLGNY